MSKEYVDYIFLLDELRDSPCEVSKLCVWSNRNERFENFPARTRE